MSSTDENDPTRPAATNGDVPSPAPSTTWEWRRIKKKGTARQGQQERRPKGGRWHSLARRDPRKKITVEIYYRGGPEAWYAVRARGVEGYFHGATAIHDIMREVNEGCEYWDWRSR